MSLYIAGCRIFCLFVPSQIHNTFGDVARLNGLEGLQDFLMVSTELQFFLLDRPQHRILTMPIDVFAVKPGKSSSACNPRSL